MAWSLHDPWVPWCGRRALQLCVCLGHLALGLGLHCWTLLPSPPAGGMKTGRCHLILRWWLPILYTWMTPNTMYQGSVSRWGGQAGSCLFLLCSSGSHNCAHRLSAFFQRENEMNFIFFFFFFSLLHFWDLSVRGSGLVQKKVLRSCKRELHAWSGFGCSFPQTSHSCQWCWASSALHISGAEETSVAANHRDSSSARTTETQSVWPLLSFGSC